MARQSSAKLLSEALKLPTVQRARIAAALLASVDGPPSASDDAEWTKELQRRVQRVRRSGPRGEEWHVVHERLAGKFRRRRGAKSSSSPKR